MIGKAILAVLVLLIPGSLVAQTITVFDEDQLPLPNAHVSYEGLNGEKQNTVLTDRKGTVVLPKDFTDQFNTFLVTISYIGFKSQRDTIRVGDNKTYVLEADPVTLNQVVITAQYAPSDPEKAVHKVKIIDRKRIDAQGAVNLRDVLQNETNIRLAQDNILGSSVSIQGLSGQNVKILMDGVPMVGRQDGNIDLGQINLYNIERIEIVEGPLSVNYGTNALAGTINLISKKDQKLKRNVGLDAYYETVGQYNISGRLGWKLGKGTMIISGGRNYFDGWSPSDGLVQIPESKPADTSRVQQWNPKEQYFAKLQYNFQHKGFTVRPYIDVFTETITNKGYPRAPYGESAFDDHYNTHRLNGGADLSGKVGNGLNLNFLAAYNNYQRIKNTYVVDLTTLNEQLTADPAGQDTTKFDLFMSRASISTAKDSAKLNYELGYDINVESAYGKRVENNEQDQGDYAVFGSVEWEPLLDLVVRPGIRWAYNTTYSAPVIPSLNLRYIHNRTTIRASYARGFRAPSLKELYFDFVDINHNIVGNSDLQAEQSNNFQLHVTWQKAKETTFAKLEAGVYFNNVNDLITLAQRPGSSQFSYVNISKFSTIGFEGNAELAWEHLKFSVGGAYIGRSNELAEEGPSLPGAQQVDKYSFSPEVRSSITYDFHSLKANFGIFYKYTGPLPGFYADAENNLTETLVNDHHMLDITFTKSIWRKRIKWTIGAKNLFDVQNITSSSTTGGVHSSNATSVPVSWGMSLFTSIKLDLNW